MLSSPVHLEALNLFYCDHYPFPLPPGHKFPLAKYGLVRNLLEGDGRFSIRPARLACRAEVVRIHTEEYVDTFLNGRIANATMRRIGFPWSPELVNRTLASAGSTLLATQAALESGFGGTLAGGTHHAFRGEGSGFCVFNDIAIAIASARSERGIRKAAIIDLDVHQGDGTAAIFGGDPDVFTLSLHGARNFPFRKQASVVDIALPDGTGDVCYLEVLGPALTRVWDFGPELVFFQSGVDSLRSDRLGRLSLTPAGLERRDQAVLAQALRKGVPIVVTMGGGYSDPIDDTVAAHVQTYRKAADLYISRWNMRDQLDHFGHS